MLYIYILDKIVYRESMQCAINYSASCTHITNFTLTCIRLGMGCQIWHYTIHCRQ